MSEQAEEWTPELCYNIHAEKGFGGLADAINAAVKAAYEKGEQDAYKNVGLGLEQQLTAELEWSKALYQKSHRHTLDVLAAEREKRKEAERKGEDLTVSGMAACGSLMKELDQEREKVKTLETELTAGQVIAQRLLRVVEQLPDVKFNSPNFRATIDELVAATKAVPTDIINAFVAEQLAAEREKVKILMEAIERSVYRDCFTAALAKVKEAK